MKSCDSVTTLLEGLEVNEMEIYKQTFKQEGFAV